MTFTEQLQEKNCQHTPTHHPILECFFTAALLLCLAMASGKSYSQAGIIKTVAGNGSIGHSGNDGDGGSAPSSGLYFPEVVAVDTAGNIYIADTDNHRIRKVTASTGLISTVAGTGRAGYSGDGGPATRAALNYPVAVAVDLSGNIYIADTQNNYIRKVTAATGIISTVAGNGTRSYAGDGMAATRAAINQPIGLAVDSFGNIYIADTDNNRIRKVTASNAIISTVAGNGTQGYVGDGGPAMRAELFHPASVAVDSNGNIFIADTNNQCIREVMVSTGKISTVAGNGIAAYLGDGETATKSELNYPYGVAVDKSGNLYIADTSNGRIRKVAASTGIISTVAGTGAQGYWGDGELAIHTELRMPWSVAVDSIGNILIADTLNERIRVVGADHAANPGILVGQVHSTSLR